MSDQDNEKALMDAAIELMQGLGETPAPNLDAATLPTGTVMVLGGIEYRLCGRDSADDMDFVCIGNGKYIFAVEEIQELIDRGVEFRIPEVKP